MNIALLIITIIQALATVFYHVAPQILPAWALVMFLALSSFALIVANRRISSSFRLYVIGVTIASLGLAGIMIFGPVIRYIGYVIAIAGLILTLVSLNIACAKKNMRREAIVVVVTIILASGLALVIVPPPPVNVPAIFSFAIGGTLLAILGFNMVGKLLPGRLLTLVLLTASFLFSGLEVVLADSAYESLLVTIVQSRLHLGVIALMFAHVVMNFEAYGVNRTNNHHL